MDTKQEGPKYPFDEFRRHYDYVHANLAEEERSFETTGRVAFDHMRSLYKDEAELDYKLIRFMLITRYIALHIHDFDRSDLAVYGSPKVGALVSEHLARAVHSFFTDGAIPAGHGPPVEEVLALANEMR